ncbi:Gfo/Idh/MocA family protein [Neobacillus sp. NPDC058068]|uniref:Gfo/Idh/MocA family protein n=1 Tax=Neobacillus sp. NPDC058068 TaxID=3346325 RepID=UPI0036DF9458
MGRKIKWGILSTATIAVEQVIPAIQQSSNGEVYAVASSSGKAADVAEQFHIPNFYESYEELLKDSSIEAVYIPLPNNSHYEWTIKAARAKKHVLCEKPAALDPKKVEEMILACKNNGVIFMEGFMYRFHPQHKKVKELLTEKVIGDIKMVRAYFSFYMEDRVGNIRLNPNLGGGALYDIGCYCINSIRYILGTEPLNMAILGDMNPDGVDTSAAAVMLFPGNVYTAFMCSFDATLKHEYEIIGTKGTIRVPYAYRPDLNAGNGMVQIYLDNEYKEFIINGDQYLLEVEHFADCIINNREPSYTGEDSLANLKVIDSLIEKLTNQPVQ